MSRALWQMLPATLTGLVGYAVWLFTHSILHAPTPIAGTAAVGSGLAAGLAAHLLMAIAKPSADEDPHTPLERAILRQEHVPASVERAMRDDDTVWLDTNYQGRRRVRRLKAGERP